VIDSAPRMATAKALENSTVLFLSKREFEERLAGSDVIVRGVMAILSERLRDIQRRK
jgi:CRP-like cAMP-binding protein